MTLANMDEAGVEPIARWYAAAIADVIVDPESDPLAEVPGEPAEELLRESMPLIRGIARRLEQLFGTKLQELPTAENPINTAIQALGARGVLEEVPGTLPVRFRATDWDRR